MTKTEAIKWLSNLKMDIGKTQHQELWHYEQALDEIIQALEQESKTGYWIENDNGTFSCSNCQSWIPEEQYHYARFCLHCGARIGE